MANYSVTTKDEGQNARIGVYIELLSPGQIDDGAVIDVEDFYLMYGALAAAPTVRQIRMSHPDSITLTSNHTDSQAAIESVMSATSKITQFSSEMEERSFQDAFGVLRPDFLTGNFSWVKELSFQFFDLLCLFEEDTNNSVGRLFRQYVDVYPGDDLTREYQFNGGSRILVIPKVGSCNRIVLPEDLTCHNPRCSIGKLNQSVRQMNQKVARIDWECLQIAHKMKDHQETDIPNGPYWVINPE